MTSNGSENGDVSNELAELESTDDPGFPLNGPSRPSSRTFLNAAKRGACAMCKMQMCKIVVITCFIAVIVGAATVVVVRFVILSPTKGCFLSLFEHGMQSECDPVSDGMIAPLGSTCKFSCEDGYVISENVTELKCGSNGVWLGLSPYCRKIRQCPLLKKPANGGDFNCTSGNFEESKCSFSCGDGYQLRRPGGDVEPSPGAFDIYCESDDLSNYQWSGEEPYCEKEVACPSSISNQSVMMKCTTPHSINSKSDLGSQKNQTYPNGTICTFSCPDVTLLERAVCLNTGKWNTTISCIKAECYRTQWKKAEMDESIEKLQGVSVYGSISKLSRLLVSGDNQYFIGEMINECSTIPFVCFDQKKYGTMKRFKTDSVTVQLLNVDIQRTEKYGLQVLINDRGAMIRSERKVPIPSLNITTTSLSKILTTTSRMDKVNVRVRVISKEPAKPITLRGKSVLLYVSHLSDDTAEIDLKQWTNDTMPLNKTVVITDLKVKSYRGKKYLQMTSLSEVKP